MDQIFLEKLKDKLQFGNLRSIHLNAIPGRSATRLDLFDLSCIEEAIPNAFLNELLSKPSFSYSFSINLNEGIKAEKNESKDYKKMIVSKRLTSIRYENDDNYLEHGIKTFAFGYPILVYRSKQDPSKVIKAPIFVWDLDLSMSTTEADTCDLTPSLGPL